MIRARSARQAFTLVELVLVLAIMGVLAAVAAPRYAASMANYRVRLAAHRVAADVALTQAAARAASASRALTFDVPGNRYTVSGLGALDGRGGGYTVQLAAQPYGVSIKTLTLTKAGANGALTFDGFGVPDGGATVVVSFGTYNRTVTVSAASGAATVQ